MKYLFLLLLAATPGKATPQFYYNDIAGNTEITARMKKYKENLVQKITATGYDGNGQRSTDFNEQHDILLKENLLRITTLQESTINNLEYYFDASGQLLRLKDTEPGITSITTYSYNASGKIISITNTSGDDAGKDSQLELHLWKYDETGNAKEMLRIVNGDTLRANFLSDENGNIIEEIYAKQGIETDRIYYYYDDNNRLLDIVRYNYKLQKLMPDLMFEYDEKNNLVQKITIVSTAGIGYLTWRYIYNEKGLRTKEVVFDKHKQQTGRIDYQYVYSK